MCVAAVPVVGITLPFVSYGGSSVMATIFVFFIIQGIHLKLVRMEQYQEEIEHAEE